MDKLPAPFSSYHTLDGAIAALRARAKLEEVCYGKSVCGRDLLAYRFGSGARRVLYVANIHAMEFLGTEVILALAQALQDSTCEVWLIPCANPDGRMAAEELLQSGGRRFLRGNANGVDLNRNFTVHFDRDYWLHRMLPQIYRSGSAPFSEPETAALRNFLAGYPPHYALSLHAFGGWIFYPWGARRESTPHDEKFASIAKAMAARMQRPYRCRQLGKWARGFSGRGMEIDYLYGQHGTLAFLMELSQGGTSLADPRTWFRPTCWFNPPNVQREIDNVLPAALSLTDCL